MRNNGGYFELDDLLLDNEFVKLVKKGDAGTINSLIQMYPHKRQVIEDAITLIRNLKIEETPPEKNRSEQDYRKLMDDIGRKHKRNILIRITISAACAVIIILLFIGVERYQRQDTYPLQAFENYPVNTDNILIISGTSVKNVKDSAVIHQTQEGTVVIETENVSDRFDADAEHLQLIVPYGKRSTVTFSDGTIVWLNSGTRLIYPKQFKKNKREIFVDGEIYLEVAADRSVPFIVRTGKFNIKVLGTKFNINAYERDDAGSVVLVEGSIEVQVEKTKRKLIPAQGLFVEKRKTELRQTDTYYYTCWKDGFMKLNGESLDYIFNKLTRHYNLNFIYNRDIAEEKYIGKLNLSESVETVLYNLSLSTPFTYKRNGNKIYIE